MRSLSIVLSLLLHGAVAVLALFFPFGGGQARVDLNKPVYEVELLRLPEKKTPPKQQIAKPEPAQAKKKPSPEPSKQVGKAPEQPAPQPKPRAVKIPEEQKKQPPEPAKERKQQPKPKKAPEEPRKPKTSPQAPTREEVLAEALGEAKSEAEQSERQERDELAQALAALKQSVSANRTTRGSARSGGSQVEDIYAQIVEGRIKEHWRYPSLGSRQNLQAEVELRIDAQGNVSEFSLVRDSGRRDFDRSVLRAVEEAGSLPAPPRQDIRTIRITFNLQEQQG